MTEINLDTSAGRVKTPLSVDLPYLGTLLPRAVKDIAGSNWILGCETLDRDYAVFDNYKKFLAPLGIKKIRLQAGWAKCEKVKGKYDFKWLDDVVDYARSQGIECILETDYGNAVYPGGGGWDLSGGFPYSEEALQGWDAWVKALAEHFKGRVRDWAMWNEPDIPPLDGSPKKTPADIAKFNVRTAKIIRGIIPDAEIGGLSLASISPILFEDCLRAMGDDVKMFSSIIYHGYANAPEESYGAVEKMKEILARYNPQAKLRQGENGCPSELAQRFALSSVQWSEYSQAKWDMRRMLGDLGHDVESSIFTICDFNHTGREINLKGLLRADEDKEVIAVKRAYYAVQNLTAVFDNTLTRVKDSDWDKGFGARDLTISTYEYQTAGRVPLFVFWESAIPVPADDESADVRLPGESWFALKYVRPGDSFATRPMTFRYNGEGKILENPVWVDLLTGRVYEIPRENVHQSKASVRYMDIPVYDSPCILTDRAALKFMK